jgi:hypothetical protein
MSLKAATPPRLASTAAVLVAIITSLLTAHPARAAIAQTRVASLEPATLTLLRTELNAYQTTEGGYSNGYWNSSDDGCWACNEGGPATAAATAYVLGGADDATLLHEAEQTINLAIATRQTPDGSFSSPAWDTTPADITTMFFGVEFGTTYELLSPYLDPATRRRWQRSLAAAATWLVNHGDAMWYSNGNINLGFAELFYLAWKATGEASLLRDYNNEWAFVTNPPQNRFPGAGLKIVRPSTARDGLNGKGYLAEIGPGGTGFDAEYTMLQLDVASRLYLLSGDPRALRLANLEMNMLRPRVTPRMMLITSDGTRKTEPNAQEGFQDSAAAVLCLFDGRSNLAGLAASDLTFESDWFRWASQDNPVFRRALGNSIAVAALAEAMYKSHARIVDELSAPSNTYPLAAIAARANRGGVRARRLPHRHRTARR